ncbi:MAG: HAD family phosphatase [Desulfarculaceae bacterium]|nr:HAD family phosphatase [Desulfarculaceae bacterium]
MKPSIDTLLLDIGGVLLTNGWDRHSRKEACAKFGLDPEDTDERHHLTFDTYEEGKLSLDEYLERVVFHQPRPFGPAEFKEFMFAQSEALPDMLDFIRRLKQAHGLHVVAVSNEGRELTEHRIAKFRLHEVFDFFVSSCFVHYRKPDQDMYRLALDGVQSAAHKTVYIDDRLMFVQVAQSLGLHGIHHQGYASTRQQLAELGLADQ